MARRFPPPIVGVPQSRERYDTIVSIVAGAPERTLPWEDFLERCRERYRRPESDEAYSETYLARILPTYDRLGVIDRADGAVTLSPAARNWVEGRTEFEEFLWRAIKRRWVLMNESPTGIEGLREVHDAVVEITEERDDATVSRGTIRRYLGDERGYEFNENDVRGYPRLLAHLGALERVGEEYRPGPSSATYSRRFRETDIFRQFEQRLRREGANVVPPADRVKRDLVKYYMYRESGGLGKERTWYDTFWKDFLDETARRGETPRANLRKHERYRDVRDERQDVFEAVRDEYDALKSKDLRGLSTDALSRMKRADSFDAAQRIKIAAGSGITRLDLSQLTSSERSPYTFPDDFELHPWQREAVDDWFTGGTHSAERRGIAQVVTGAGKTVMALEVVREWLAENPEGVVTVLVPTKVLMHQWLTEFASKLNVPVEDIGWAGGGHKDSFTDGRRVLVSIVNTAVKDDYLGSELRAAGSPPHLLVADECHRYTGEKFSNVFEYPRTASLGLSATPLSKTVTQPATESDLAEDDEFDLQESDELLLSELGSIYYTLTYDEGLDRGLIPRFSINYIGFDLTNAERQTYDRLTRKISNTLKDIRSKYGYRLDSLPGGFHQKLQMLLNDEEVDTPEVADFFEYTSERRELVADAATRQAITLELLEGTLEDDQKAIVFQERIEQLERMIAPLDRRGRNVRTDEVTDEESRAELYELYPALETVDKRLEELFGKAKYKPVMYHSGHSRSVWNDFAMEWFRDEGFANTMLSVKALIEGVDVPSADVGIVRVSSSSVRQRIQTLGRVLRTGDDPSKHSELYILYARDTVDANIFAKHDWESELANAEINHYTWETDDSGVEGELREARPDELPERGGWEELEIPDPDGLRRGDPYPGPRDGYRISVDSDGVPFRKETNRRRPITTDVVRDAADYVYRTKGGGTIVINEAGHMVTHLEEEGYVFVGVLEDGIDAIEFGEAEGKLSGEAPSSLDDL